MRLHDDLAFAPSFFTKNPIIKATAIYPIIAGRAASTPKLPPVSNLFVDCK